MLISNTLEMHSRKIGVRGRVFIKYHPMMVYDGFDSIWIQKNVFCWTSKNDKNMVHKNRTNIKWACFFVPLNFYFFKNIPPVFSTAAEKVPWSSRTWRNWFANGSPFRRVSWIPRSIFEQDILPVDRQWIPWFTSWWFQPIWKMLVKMGIFPKWGWK